MRLPFSFLSPGSDSSVCVLLALFLELPSHFRLFSNMLTPCCDWQCLSNLLVTAIKSSLCCSDSLHLLHWRSTLIFSITYLHCTRNQTKPWSRSFLSVQTRDLLWSSPCFIIWPCLFLTSSPSASQTHQGCPDNCFSLLCFHWLPSLVHEKLFPFNFLLC